MMWLWMVGSALAGPHMNIVFDVGVEVPLGEARGVGVRFGGGLPVLLGDACDYRETDCRDGRGWPYAGPRAGLRWSKRDSLTLELGGNLGFFHGDVHQIGWIPLWTAEARMHAELGVDGVSLAVGGVGGRSLSWRKNVTPTGYTTGGGMEALSLQLGVLARPLGAERASTAVMGLSMVTVAADSY